MLQRSQHLPSKPSILHAYTTPPLALRRAEVGGFLWVLLSSLAKTMPASDSEKREQAESDRVSHCTPSGSILVGTLAPAHKLTQYGKENWVLYILR